ncbi:helix-turn-helix transcriptional regulator [candidate division KSB1 bacterium]|nr:helix-turn-helix transcriptional regulator [candidate division KSB1 bacterium]MBL7094493.1 helix-turn-helix transcriptional regulator [candidate division KSB1 bacterium]
MSTVAFKDFKKKAFSNSEVKSEYDYLIPAYELRKKLIRLRKQAGLTQEEMAKILHTKKSNISRLENVNSNISPKISTIESYARAVGYNLEFNFIPISPKKEIVEKRVHFSASQ